MPGAGWQVDNLIESSAKPVKPLLSNYHDRMPERLACPEHSTPLNFSAADHKFREGEDGHCWSDPMWTHVGDGVQDEASTSGSDMDDDAMEESGMDAKIAAVLRGTAEAKASVQKTKEAATQLRFRVRPFACNPCI